MHPRTRGYSAYDRPLADRGSNSQIGGCRQSEAGGLRFSPLAYEAGAYRVRVDLFI